jgi:dipeptidyl aminopeptidase/acylaminoacyl peptidase
VAYLAGEALYTVGGDGRGAHLLARHVLAVAPAWRPGAAAHMLAYAAPDGVHVVAADSGREGAHVRSTAQPIALSWRADGRRLAVLDDTGVTLYSSQGRRLRRLAAEGRVLAGGYTRVGDRLVVLRRDAGDRVSLLVRATSGPLRAVRHLAITAIGDLRLSPDGRRALIVNRESDEWIEVRLRDGRLQRLRDIGQRLRAGFAPRVLAWAG